MGVTINGPADVCGLCGKFRRAHSIASFCPTGKAGKGGVYTQFLEQKFQRVLPQSAIAKHRITIGQCFMAADGGNHGYLIKDIHPNATGDFVTVQNVTPLGKDGKLTRVDARVMAEQTHYEAEPPSWFTQALKGKR